jgi:hypothetical protein
MVAWRSSEDAAATEPLHSVELKAAFVTAGTIAILVHRKGRTRARQPKGCGRGGRLVRNQADNSWFDRTNGAAHLASRHGSTGCYIH